MVEVGPDSFKNGVPLGESRPTQGSPDDRTMILGPKKRSHGMGLPEPIDPKSPTRMVPVVESNSLHILSPGMKLGAVRVGKKLGAGNMGIVYLGHHEALDRAVVVKTLSPQRLMGDGSAEVIARFYEEARSVARLSHQNIAQIFDVGRHKGFHYLIMEFVDGCSLGDYLKSKVLTVEEKICLVLGVASGLGAAHKCGVVHRDIKPDNIMINQDGQAKIVDFGLAKRHGSAGLTSDQTVLGTPYFMAPEQCDGRDIDGRADLYALGVTAFWMFTGQYPFNGKHPVQVIMARLRQPAPLIQKINPNIPPSLAAVINRLLLADPKERYQSAKGLIRDISTLSLTAKASGSGSAGKVAFRAVERSDRLSKSNPIDNPNAWPWLLAAGAALILFVSLVGFVIVRNRIRDARDLGTSQGEAKLKNIGEKNATEAAKQGGDDDPKKTDKIPDLPPQKDPKDEIVPETALKDWPVQSRAQQKLIGQLASQLNEATAIWDELPKKRDFGKKREFGKRRLAPGKGKKIRRLNEAIGQSVGELYNVSRVDDQGAFQAWAKSAFQWTKKSLIFRSEEQLRKAFAPKNSSRVKNFTVDQGGVRVTKRRDIVAFALNKELEGFESARLQFKLVKGLGPKHEFLLGIESQDYAVIFSAQGYYVIPGSNSINNDGMQTRGAIMASVLRRGISPSKKILNFEVNETLTIFIHRREDGLEWIVKDSDSTQRFLLPKRRSGSDELLLRVGSSAQFLSLHLGEKTVGNP